MRPPLVNRILKRIKRATQPPRELASKETKTSKANSTQPNPPNAAAHAGKRSGKPKRRYPFPDMEGLCRDVPNPVIFDIGAHHGKIATRFRRSFPSAEIYAFEPFSESFSVLSEATHDDSRIHCFNLGLAEEAGPRPFHSNMNSNTNSLLATDPRGPELWGEGLLETKEIVTNRFTTVDSFTREHSIDHIDILKMDVQGAEHLVLEGARRIIREGKVGIVYCEISTQPSYVGQKRFDKALADYFDVGFELHNLYYLSSTDTGTLRQLDAIFLHANR